MNEVEIGTEDSRLRRNLKDAGCGAAAIEKFFQLQKAGKVREQLHLLSRQRAELLKKVHENQKKIDCLDYLLYNLKTTN